MSTLTTTLPGTGSGNLEPYVYRPELIPLVWDEMEAVLMPCFEATNGMLNSKQVYEWLMQEHAVAFATVRNGRLAAVLVVLKVNYASYSVARIIACAGKDLKGAMQFIDALEAWALTQGCVEIEGWCLKSAARLVRRYGWKDKLTIVTRDLRRRLQ